MFIQQISAMLDSGVWAVPMSAVVLGLIRIVMFISIIPVFGPNVTSAVKFSIAAALYIPLHPYLVATIEPFHMSSVGDFANLIVIFVKEALIGFILGWLTSLVFYVALSAGTIVDNQRGASMAQGSDPLTGGETSPLGLVLFMSVIALFFSSGAFVRLLELFYSTYVFWPPHEILPGLTSRNMAVYSLENLSWMMENAFLVAAPFVLVALASDISLGLVNRFAPQLNVFILSMSIKSAICSFLLIFYYNPFLEKSTSMIDRTLGIFNHLRMMFGFEQTF